MACGEVKEVEDGLKATSNMGADGFFTTLFPIFEVYISVCD